jgi:hypothetical protein
MNTPLAIIPALFLFLTIGCTPHHRQRGHNHIESHQINPAETTRICDIQKKPHSYMGSIVRISGNYKSDHMYYTYLLDTSCITHRTLDVDHPANTSGDKSVHRFFSTEDRLCNKKTGTVCPISWNIVADILIKEQGNGELVAELKHVEEFIIPPH